MPLWHAGGQEFESPWLHFLKSLPLEGFFNAWIQRLKSLESCLRGISRGI